MSSSNPPNPNTPPVFNNDAFNQGANPTIDTAYLNANYLKFPTAQGLENLGAINVAGAAAFSQLPTCSIVPTLSTQLVNKAYVDIAPPVDNLNAVLTAGDNAGGLNIAGVLNLTTTGTNTFSGLINQSNSSFNAITTSTSASTSIYGGSISISEGIYATTYNSQQIQLSDHSAGIDQISISKNQLLYDNDTGNASQLLIASYSTDNPIIIQSNGASAGGGGITMETTQSGAPIIIQALSTLSPPTPANIQLITCNGLSVGGQSSIIMETDVVFVKNGAMRFMNNPTSYLTGLLINENSANNFQVNNSSGNLALNGTQLQLTGVVTITQTTYPPTIDNALGYQSNSVPHNFVSTPYVPPNANDNYTGSSFVIAKRGMYSITLTTTYCSTTTANVSYQSSYISTSAGSNTKLVGSEINNTTQVITASGTSIIQRRVSDTFVWNTNTDNVSFFFWVGNNTAGAKQNIGLGAFWTKIG